MTNALHILHITVLALFTLTIQLLLHAHFAWAPDVLIGLAVALAFYLRWDGVGLFYALVVWALSLVPYYPAEAIALLGCVVAVVALKKIFSMSGWVHVALLSFFGVLLFYVIIAPRAALEHGVVLAMSAGAVAVYTILISWYLKHAIPYVEST